MPPSQDPLYAGLGQAIRIGTELLAALIVGGGLGYLADWYFDSKPVGIFVGVFLGMSAGLMNVYRSFSRL
jgi:ATP synthase protein I